MLITLVQLELDQLGYDRRLNYFKLRTKLQKEWELGPTVGQ
jgi:hypothetical protein